MNTLDTLQRIRNRFEALQVERDLAVKAALAEGYAQHEVAVAAGMGVRTVGDIARKHALSRSRGRPRKEPR